MKSGRGRPRNPDQGGHTFADIWWMVMDFYQIQAQEPDLGPYAICRRMSEMEFYKSEGRTYDSIKSVLLRQLRSPRVRNGFLAERTNRLHAFSDMVVEWNLPDAEEKLQEIDGWIRAMWPPELQQEYQDIPTYPQKLLKKMKGQK